MKTNQPASSSTFFPQDIFLSKEDAARCFGSISKLARHFIEPVIITGSLAINWHVLTSGAQIKKGRLNDIDLVVAGLSSIRDSLSQDFLISHFHPYREMGKILIQLVDEESGTRIDVFTPNSMTLIKRLSSFAIGDLSCRVVSAEDLLAKLLGIIYSVTKDEAVELKYFERFNLLYQITDLEKVTEVWPEYRKQTEPRDFEEAAERVRHIVAANPGLLQTGSYSLDLNQTCRWCQRSETFPLVSRSRMFEILGYV